MKRSLGDVLLRNYLPLVVAGIWLIVILAYYIFARLSFTDPTIFYELIVFYRQTAIYTVVATIGFLGVVFALCIVFRRRLSRNQDAALAAALILLFIAVPFSCWANIGIFAEFSNSFVHIDRVTYGDYLYQLAFLSDWDGGNTSYGVYRCDSLGFVCDRVAVLDTSSGTDYAQWGSYTVAQQAKLTMNETGLTVQVSGEMLPNFTVSVN